MTNTKVAPLYLEKVADALTRGNPNVSVDSVVLPDGEKYKNMVDGKTKIWLFKFILPLSVKSPKPLSPLCNRKL